MNDVLRIARLKIALQRAFLGRAILIFTRHLVTIITIKVTQGTTLLFLCLVVAGPS